MKRTFSLFLYVKTFLSFSYYIFFFTFWKSKLCSRNTQCDTQIRTKMSSLESIKTTMFIP